MRKGDDFFRVTFDRKWDDTKIFEKKITYYQNRHHLTNFCCYDDCIVGSLGM